MASETKKKLGEILIDQKFITEDQLALGIEKQKISKKKLGEILTELGFVTEEKLIRLLPPRSGGSCQRWPLPSLLL